MDSPTLNAGRNEITFKSQGHRLAGLLFAPEGFDAAKTYPTVIFSPPFNQVKEQTGAVYGRKLAQKGYVVLAFDHIGYGDSEGETRNYENANIKIESIRDAISFLGTLPFVDRERLFGLGICASGGYMALAATTDKRLKAIATVSGMMDNQRFFFGLMDRDTVVAALEAANDARQQWYETGEPVYMDGLGYSTMPEEERAALDKDSARYEGYEFYMTERAGTQTYPNYSYMTLANIMETNSLANATAYAPYLYTPYIGIYGEKAMGPGDTGPLTVNFYEAASEPKELVEIKGASHVSLYDIDEDVDRAIDRMIAFFEKHGN